MKRVATGYCAACDAQVTGKGEAARTGPDGCLYCVECMDLLRLLHQQREPRQPLPDYFATAVAEPGRVAPRPRTGAFPRVGSSARLAAVAPEHKPPVAKVAAGAIVIALVVAAVVWRPGGRRAAVPADAAATTPAAGSTSAPAAAGTPTPVPAIDPVVDAHRTGPTQPAIDPDPPKTAPTAEPEPDPDPPIPAGEVDIPANDLDALRAQLGKPCTVIGIVARAAAARSGKVFRIDFGSGRDAFQAVLFPRHFAAFEHAFGPLEQALNGKSVRVRGTVSEYQGRLQIVLEETSQLELK